MKKSILLMLVGSLLFTNIMVGCSNKTSVKDEDKNIVQKEDDGLVEENNEATKGEDVTEEAPKEEEIKEETKKEEIKEEPKKEEPKKEDIKEETPKEEPKNEGNKFKDITIVVDPGHSSSPKKGTEAIAPGSQTMKAKDVSGAMGKFSNVPEHRLNMQIANLLKEDLEKRGFTVVMTKDKVEQSISNIERAEVGNKLNAALTIRIHGDSHGNPDVNGASMLIPSKNNPNTSNIADISRTYGEKILNKFVQSNPVKNRGLIVREDLTGFNWSKVPVVLIEMGFLSNKNDDLYLNNAANQRKIAESIGAGIEECFK